MGVEVGDAGPDTGDVEQQAHLCCCHLVSKKGSDVLGLSGKDQLGCTLGHNFECLLIHKVCIVIKTYKCLGAAVDFGDSRLISQCEYTDPGVTNDVRYLPAVLRIRIYYYADVDLDPGSRIQKMSKRIRIRLQI